MMSPALSTAPNIFIATICRQRSKLREASPSFVRVPPPDPGGAISSVRVPPPEPLPCRMLAGNGLPRGVRGRPFSLLQRRNRPQTPPVSEGEARALDMLIYTPNAVLTCVHRALNYDITYNVAASKRFRKMIACSNATDF
ncbi:serine--tRNA ligase-like [Dorcoceras hygrometricum]|uniref:Serine--tRNA ligase-like n=1 Tax=Dorcoceras hygrometricum TaxID=472368 RepID=A0A2Z7AIR9_9LAMI|nr:serine--tRNA ligase-like [Dorcoceras hygrometricum]